MKHSLLWPYVICIIPLNNVCHISGICSFALRRKTFFQHNESSTAGLVLVQFFGKKLLLILYCFPYMCEIFDGVWQQKGNKNCKLEIRSETLKILSTGRQHYIEVIGGTFEFEEQCGAERKTRNVRACIIGAILMIQNGELLFDGKHYELQPPVCKGSKIDKTPMPRKLIKLRRLRYYECNRASSKNDKTSVTVKTLMFAFLLSFLVNMWLVM